MYVGCLYRRTEARDWRQVPSSIFYSLYFETVSHLKLELINLTSLAS